MAIREIRKKGDPCLEKVCHPVTEFNERLHLLLDDMRETLEESGGVGLAAVQVGVLRRLFVMDVGDGLVEAVNPQGGRRVFTSRDYPAFVITEPAAVEFFKFFTTNQ